MISCFKGKFKVTSTRSYRTLGGKNEYHAGLDLVALEDKNIYAIADGIVDATPYEKNGFGYYVRQKLDDGRRIYYGHMKTGSFTVKKGQYIKKGDKLGVMGSTGSSTGAHTHLEIRVPGTSKESLDICDFTGIPNEIGTYDASLITPEIAAENVRNKCGFEEATMQYLSQYKYADDLFLKLWKAME
ncbi:MAG: M23 family metallopeptidase [Ruminococcaceae bacterium]|nr:M23 family metallopeptidase [Oscillospiraceae bacterium]